MAEYEDPELTFFHGHINIKTMNRANINEKDQNLEEKIFYN